MNITGWLLAAQVPEINVTSLCCIGREASPLRVIAKTTYRFKIIISSPCMRRRSVVCSLGRNETHSGDDFNIMCHSTKMKSVLERPLKRSGSMSAIERRTAGTSCVFPLRVTFCSHSIELWDIMIFWVVFCYWWSSGKLHSYCSRFFFLTLFGFH